MKMLCIYCRNIHKMSQGPSNPGFRFVKVQIQEFFLKETHYISKKILIWLPMNTQQAWKAKLEDALSFDIYNCKNAVY